MIQKFVKCACYTILFTHVKSIWAIYSWNEYLDTKQKTAQGDNIGKRLKPKN